VDRSRPSDVTARVALFADLLTRSEPPLDELALAVSAALQPTVDVTAVQAELDRLAEACPTPTRDGVITHLFGSGHFQGDRRTYGHWHNSCLDHVVARRLGMPITLSVVAIEVARRLGVELAGVGMPGHFLVGDPADPNWYADPFHGTTGLDPAACRSLLTKLGVDGWSAAFLAVTPPRQVVARILNNLHASCVQSGDRVRVAIVLQLRQQLPQFAGEAPAAHDALAVFN